MGYKIEPVEINDDSARPYVVTVNGVTLLDKRGRPRRFSSSITAAVAGSNEACRLRRLKLMEVIGLPINGNGDGNG